MTHLALQSYALIVLAGLDDMKFFQQGNQLALPIINASVALSWFIPVLALLSFLVFVYWQMYHRKMWLLAHEVAEAAALHRKNPDFVPAHGSYRYPWIAFFVADEDRAFRVGVSAFSFFQWVPMPLVQLVCWTRTVRLDAEPIHWLTAGLPWSPCFGFLCIASVAVVWWFRRLQRRLTHREYRTAPTRRRLAIEAWCLRHTTLVRCLRVLRSTALMAATAATLAIAVVASAAYPLQLKHLRGQNRDFTALKVRNAHLQGAKLQGAKLQGANLEGANLEGANLEGANLERANLQHAGLEGANIVGANLHGAKLEGADLNFRWLLGANLERANLHGANRSRIGVLRLRGPRVGGSFLQGVRYDYTTVLPLGLDPIARGMSRAGGVAERER